ncbi:MAG TPA: tetratricopeptide repeat protein [Chitinophagaceae bacterium]|nr:tetratricopeptide repeat protein [Chitinophagaceae bacterium]
MKLYLLLAALLLAGVLGSLQSKKPARTHEDYFKSRPPVFCAPSFDPNKMNEGNAPLFKGLGNLHYTVTTNSPKAQQYFNQGLKLLYGFNHGEAGRSFKASIKADSTCAMAYWGLGMVLAPNYNAALNPSSLADINEAMDKALLHSAKASPREKALIRALSKRFPREPVQDMSPYNAAYSAAMKEAYLAFPNDPEIGTLYADALMNEHPWNLWLKDGTPQPWTTEIVHTLEALLRKFPEHPGANHAYIHAVEASAHPQKGLASARRLEHLMPAAGHLVHMPAHIYIRTGHYHRGVVTTERAESADSNYVVQCKVQGAYPMMYYPHNIHFLAACAFFEGNSKKAIEAAWRVSAKADRRYLHENISVQHFYSIPYYVMVHMGKWDDIMALPMPGESLRYPRAVWHYARGMAQVAKGNLQAAAKELEGIKPIAADESLKTMLIWDINSAADLVQIAYKILTAEIAAARQQYGQSISLLKEAVYIEDKLTYQEPPDWFFSVRHSLGHVLVKAGRFAEAQQVYEQDLRTYPENGWALMGLYNSLIGQQKTAEAEAVQKRFNTAWQYADISITSSRIQ